MRDRILSHRKYTSGACVNCLHGENLAMINDPAECSTDASKWLEMWNRESKYYDCEQGVSSPWGGTGHWTQVVWQASTHVGCAFNCNCGGAFNRYLVCHYGPAGNTGGRPFPPSQCKYSDEPPPHAWMSSAQLGVTLAAMFAGVLVLAGYGFAYCVLK